MPASASIRQTIPLTPSNVETLLEVVRREGELLNYHQAARALGVSHQRVSQLVASGRLRGVQVCGLPYIPAREAEARRALGARSGRPPRKLLAACC